MDARKGWQDSGVTLAAGDKVTISYSSGQWTHFPKEVPPFSGGLPPDDYTYICAEGLPASDCVEQIPDFQAGALIGRVGSQMLRVGDSLQVTVEGEGALLLRINDGDDGLHDNQGEISVVVVVEEH